MAYDKEELIETAKKVIKKHQLIFMIDVIELMGIASSTFYDHFPSNSSTHKELEILLKKNRIGLKVNMRRKWYESDNAALQIALMKIIGSDEERQRMSVNYNEVKHSGEVSTPLDLSKLSDEALNELERAIEENGEQGTEKSNRS